MGMSGIIDHLVYATDDLERTVASLGGAIAMKWCDCFQSLAASWWQPTQSWLSA